MNILNRRLAKLEAVHIADDSVTIYSWEGDDIDALTEGCICVDREPGEAELLFVERALRELARTATDGPRVIWASRDREARSNQRMTKPYADVFRLAIDPTGSIP